MTIYSTYLKEIKTFLIKSILIEVLFSNLNISLIKHNFDC